MSKDLDELARIKEAQDRADRIRAGFSQVADWWRDVIKAYGARDWESLGYTSWDAYLAGEYGEHQIRIDPRDRQDVVTAMAATGMSTRAIAPALGVGKSTVDRDLAGVPSGTPTKVTGLDGRTQSATKTPSPSSPTRLGLLDRFPIVPSLYTEPVSGPAYRITRQLSQAGYEDITVKGKAIPDRPGRAEVKVTSAATGLDADEVVLVLRQHDTLDEIRTSTGSLTCVVTRVREWPFADDGGNGSKTAMDSGAPMRHVITVLRDSGSGTLSELARTYQHGLGSDLSRVRAREGLDDDSTANAWCALWAASRLLKAGMVTVTEEDRGRVVTFAPGIDADHVYVDDERVYTWPPWGLNPLTPAMAEKIDPARVTSDRERAGLTTESDPTVTWYERDWATEPFASLRAEGCTCKTLGVHGSYHDPGDLIHLATCPLNDAGAEDEDAEERKMDQSTRKRSRHAGNLTDEEAAEILAGQEAKERNAELTDPEWAAQKAADAERIHRISLGLEFHYALRDARKQLEVANEICVGAGGNLGENNRATVLSEIDDIQKALNAIREGVEKD
jgi:hypothetical protein